MRQHFYSHAPRFTALVRRYRLPALIAGIIGVALLITAVNLWLYVKSGTSSLDLSRPGYEQVRTQVISNEAEREFSSTGVMNHDVVEEFRTMFNQQRKDVDALSGFGGDSLSDATLHMEP